jgi:TolA-binding protein
MSMSRLLAGGLILTLLSGGGVRPLYAQDEGPDVLYQQGLALFLKGDYSGAISKLQPIVDTFANEPELKLALEQVYYALGSAYYNQQDWDNVLKAYQAYLDRYPQGKYRDEVLYRIASALQAAEKFPEAVTAYRRLATEAPRSDYVEDAAFQAGLTLVQQGDMEAAITALEKFTVEYPNSALFGQAVMFLARAYFDRNETAKALDTLARTDGRMRSLDHVAFVNFLSIEIGDRAFDETDYELALRAYRHTRTRASLIRLQQRHVAQLQGALAELTRRLAGATQLVSAFREERRLRYSLRQAQELLTKIEGLPQYDAGLFHRIGGCFMSTDRFWEARVAFTRVVAEAADPKVKEAAHFDLILCLSRLRQFQKAIEEADRYLADYGKDETLLKNGRVAGVAYVRAESYINMEEFAKAEPELLALRQQFPQHPQLARVEFYLALSRAMQEKFDDAVRDFDVWLEAYPDHILRSEVEYWQPVALFYGGDYQRALPLYAEYQAKYPESVYAAEAGYRAALSKYALEDFEGAARDLEAWLQQYPDHYFKSEARVTWGDALAASGNFEAAKKAYRSVTKEAGAFYFMALNQAVKVYKALGTPEDFRDMAEAFGQYIRDNPESPNVVDAAYQAGWAMRQMGQPVQARSLYWNVLRTYGNNVTWEGFTPLLKGLADLYGKEAADVMPRDFNAEMEKARAAGQKTLAFRLKMTLIPDEEGRARSAAYRAAAVEYPMDTLGPDGLAALGSYFAGSDEKERAQPYLDRLLNDYPNSRYAPFARVRRAQQLLAAEDSKGALVEAQLAAENATDPNLFVEAVFVRAQARQGTADFAGAIEDYNTVLASRGADRTFKPKAMLGIAACHEAQGDFRKAIPFYQRIYVLYRAYTGAVAQAYLKSGQAFERLKDLPAAINTYQEMLADEKLADTPEATVARERLSRIGS